jgi:hypothetical protein
VRAVWKIEQPGLSPSNDEGPLAQLRHAKGGCVEQSNRHFVAPGTEFFPDAQLRPKQFDYATHRSIQNARNVLEYEYSRPESYNESAEVSNQLTARITQPSSPTWGAERLARGATNHRVHLTHP